MCDKDVFVWECKGLAAPEGLEPAVAEPAW